ncbi:cupin domain-containing protein [Pseudomonas sp. Z18(2022)]|uniref:cupin domain-containing protein n=1 Tax=Pseudomonas sp. Z18(2022) TaxID=2983410 RepID=UPI002E813C72|nr:cupin domain-containing protein [Pseudomonas sp. Z18(2022)]
MKDGMLILEPPQIMINPAAAAGQKKVVVSFASQPKLVPGRRSWVTYRELGVTDASHGEMRAQVIQSEGGGDTKSTGWHLHHCDMQFLYVMSGAINIAFTPEHVVRLAQGDSIMIPGGTVHTELGEPGGVNVLELSLPADMGTVSCTPPWAEIDVDLSKAISH